MYRKKSANITPPISKQNQQKNTLDQQTDFANDTFFAEIARLREPLANNKNLKKLNGNSGFKHFLYINRTFFG